MDDMVTVHGNLRRLVTVGCDNDLLERDEVRVEHSDAVTQERTSV